MPGLLGLGRRALAPVRHGARLALDPNYREIARLRALPRYQRTSTRLGGVPMEIADAATYLAQYREILERETYRFATTQARPLILDAGANVGVSVVYFKRLHPEARVVAFEPDPSLFALLARNTAALGGVELVNQAVWSASGRMRFEEDGGDSGRLVAAGPGSREVGTVSLRAWLEEPVALLKLDIEGAETEVLEDVAGLLGRVENLFVEYHSFPECAQTLDRVLRILSAAGFRYYLEAPATRPYPFLRQDAAMDAQANVFATRT